MENTYTNIYTVYISILVEALCLFLSNPANLSWVNVKSPVSSRNGEAGWFQFLPSETTFFTCLGERRILPLKLSATTLLYLILSPSTRFLHLYVPSHSLTQVYSGSFPSLFSSVWSGPFSFFSSILDSWKVHWPLFSLLMHWAQVPYRKFPPWPPQHLPHWCPWLFPEVTLGTRVCFWDLYALIHSNDFLTAIYS